MALEATALQTYQMVGLPMSVTSPVDVGRLIREADHINETMSQAELRGQTKAAKVPKTSQSLDRLIELNKLDLALSADRERLSKFLTAVHDSAPVLHISFSADPSTAFTEKLMTWLRRELHPLVLITVGLQPNLGVGCIIRGINKYFDFSLRQDFVRNEAALLEVLGPALSGSTVVAGATVEATT